MATKKNTSVANAKKPIADYKRAIGQARCLAEMDDLLAPFLA